MTLDKHNDSDDMTPEERAFWALVAMAYHYERSCERIEKDRKEFANVTDDETGLTRDEIDGTGPFSFENLKKSLFAHEDDKSSIVSPSSDESIRQEIAAIHRRESDLSDKARKELDRQRDAAVNEEANDESDSDNH